MNDLDNQFTTKDIGEATALLSSGCKLTDIHWKDKTAYFVFADASLCKVTSEIYYYGTCMVNARTYSDNLKMLKHRLFMTNQGSVYRR